MKLTDEQRISFEERGYLLLRNFVGAEQCETILDIAKAHLKHKVPPIETELEYIGKSREERQKISDAHSERYEERLTVRRLRQVYTRDIVFRQWMESGEIRPILTQLLGETPVITMAHHNSIMTKMPHSSTETSWHQDIRYWSFENDRLFSVWLALDEENSENGALEFIPGSHLIEFAPARFDEKEYFIETLPENKALIDTREQMSLGQGDLVFFHSKLLHRANRNRSDNPKISFVYTVHGRSNVPIPGTRSDSFPEVILGE